MTGVQTCALPISTAKKRFTFLLAEQIISPYLYTQSISRELILYDAAARYLKELKDSGEAITPKAWQLEIDQLAAGKQTDTLAMKALREDLKAVERLRKTAEQLSRQERDKSHDRGSDR